jgi:DNA repair exonuclease SbcCD nuclease subunit
VKKDIVYLGDLHIEQGPRWEEVVRIHNWVADYLENVKPTMVVIGGDIYDGQSTPDDREFVSDWVLRLAAVCPVLVIRGNHDRLHDLLVIAKLKGKHPIVVEEGATVHRIAGCKIAAMAWPNTATLKASGLDERTALQNVLRGLGAEMAEDDGAIPIAAAGHWLISGAVASTGQPLLGLPVTVGLEELALLNVPIVLASHIHKHQVWSWGDVVVLYAGSPYRCNYGESERKYIIHTTWEDGVTTWQAVETPARAMLLLEGEYVGPMVVLPGDRIEEHGLVLHKDYQCSEITGAEIRVRFHVESDQREAASVEAQKLRDDLLALGAYSVKLEERVIAKTRARTPGISTTSTTAQQLETLWESRHEEIAGPRKARLLEKVAAIDTEAA